MEFCKRNFAHFPSSWKAEISNIRSFPTTIRYNFKKLIFFLSETIVCLEPFFHVIELDVLRLKSKKNEIYRLNKLKEDGFYLKKY